jgi:hypothetical protein
MNKCYQCKFRGTVPGSAHSSCTVIRKLGEGMEEGKIAALELAFMTGNAKLTTQTENGEADAIKLDPQGVKNGWANWPFDFDPVWVEKCDMFIDKEEKKD